MSRNIANDQEIGTPSNESYSSDEDGGNSEGEQKTETFLYGYTRLSTLGLMAFTIQLVYAVSLVDPLFFYIPVVKNDNRKCISLDKKEETRVIYLRSFVDLLYAIYIFARLHYDFFAPCYRKYKKVELVENLWKIANKYLLRAFPIDFLSALPLPQVVLLFIVPTMMRGSRFLKAIYLLRSVVLCQYVPRVLTTYSLVLTTYSLLSGSFRGSARARAVFSPFILRAALSPFIFLLAVNGIGGLWYCLSIERLVQCWDKACEDHVGCLNLFHCNDNNVGDHTFLNDFCPRDAKKTDFFDFGMFSDAIQSRVVENTDIRKRILYCLHWSLLSLSSFGQNLQTSTYVCENVFAISITISGLYLVLVLFGYLQGIRLAKSLRKEEKRWQAEEIKHWRSFRRVPKHLKNEVRGCLRYNWLETVGDDMEKFLDKLPRDLCRRIKVELYFEIMKKVTLFEKMEKPSLEQICYHLSEVFYQEGHYVIKIGEAIDRMSFIVDGLLSVGGVDSAPRTRYDFCGEELLSWALDSTTTSIFPRSRRDVKAREKVRALSLKAEDLKFVADRFGWHYDEDSAIVFLTGTPTDDRHRTIITRAKCTCVGVRALMQRQG